MITVVLLSVLVVLQAAALVLAWTRRPKAPKDVPARKATEEELWQVDAAVSRALARLKERPVPAALVAKAFHQLTVQEAHKAGVDTVALADVIKRRMARGSR
jgi:hypothetical protein